MHIQYCKSFSSYLQREMEFKIYGTIGKPVIVFPSSGGSFYEYEDFGMIEVCKPYIEAGKLQFYTLASIDKEMWLPNNYTMEHRIWIANAFYKYLTKEITPYIQKKTGYKAFMATGCSLGAYHSVNVWLKYPYIFDQVIGLSGRYDLNFFGTNNDLYNETVYLNAPLRYLPNLVDEKYLIKYRESKIILCSGQGAWEKESFEETYRIWEIFKKKGIPAHIEFWSHEVSHDWFWWKIQMPIFLEKLGYNL